ncbi:MAG: cytosolic protein [Anaerolineaceae bacterium]|nr:cytosolic protein [Anaerolineaceae bacterium]
MNTLNMDAVRQYVNANIVGFHQNRFQCLEKLSLKRLLTKNPYLFKAKNLVTAGDLISSLLDAFLSSSEEKLFGDFLEGLAIFVAENTSGGHKSAAQGIDLEFLDDDSHYIVSIKSGTNWGNSSQHKKLAQDLSNAVIRVRQLRTGKNIQPVLGICYGKTRTSYHKSGYLKVVGQNFWYLISGNKDLYTDIIEPLGYRAKEHNDAFLVQKNQLVNRFTREFLLRFCNENGAIDWVKLVEYNSGNFDLDKFVQ